MSTTENTFNIKPVGYGEFYYGTSDVKSITPVFSAIPREFKSGNSKWRIASSIWFKVGLHKDSKLIPKKGVDKEAAIKHVQCLINCYFLNATHKIAAAAFLLSLWFDDLYMINYIS